MSYEVRTPDQIDNKNIKLGKTFKYGDNYNLTNIYYIPSNNNANANANANANSSNIDLKEIETKRQDAVDEKTKLIIQTPLMYIPNSMIYFNEKPFLELSFNNEKNDPDVASFKSWISKLEDYIFKLIKRRTSLGIEKSNLSSVLKVGYNNTSTKLIVPININVSRCILTDDGKKNKFLFNWEIPVPTYAISIIWIKNIWAKKGKWGINLFMYASRVMNSHILDPVDFMGLDNDAKSIKTYDVSKKFKDDEKMTILVGQIPEYTMFFRMLKMGIPKDAIKQKMAISGADTRIIDYPDSAPYVTVLHYISNPQLGPYVHNTSNISGGIGPPPPPPLPGFGVPPPPPTGLSPMSLLNGNDSALRSNLLNLIAGGGFKLKKVDPKETLLAKLAKSSPGGLKVPTLSDIQGALSKLKKVDIDNIV
jgi:hypothetical protein